MRRPRAQKQVRTADECGEVYNLLDPTAGDDIIKVLKNLNGRFEWIWEHNLKYDVKIAENMFEELAGLGETGAVS